MLYVYVYSIKLLQDRLRTERRLRKRDERLEAEERQEQERERETAAGEKVGDRGRQWVEVGR